MINKYKIYDIIYNAVNKAIEKGCNKFYAETQEVECGYMIGVNGWIDYNADTYDGGDIGEELVNITVYDIDVNIECFDNGGDKIISPTFDKQDLIKYLN